VDLQFATVPAGLSLTVGPASGTTPFTRTVIQNSLNSISAPATQTLNGTTYQFTNWSDGGAATHNITAPATTAPYTATYTAQGNGPPCGNGSFEATYFNNVGLTGNPVVDRCEASVNYDWGSGSPAAGVNVDNFSARWTGNFDFAAGTTTFSATADD